MLKTLAVSGIKWASCPGPVPSPPRQALHSPPTRVLALGSEEVDVGPELQLEDVLLVDAVGLPRDAHAVAQQWEAGQGVVILRAAQGGTGTAPWALPGPTPHDQPRGPWVPQLWLSYCTW